MLFRWLLFGWMFVLDLAAASGMTEDEKDLEIVLLRQQLRIVERRQQRGPDIPRWQKVPLAALAVKLKAQASDTSTRLKGSVILFKPDTVLGWHRALVRMKWTFKQAKNRGGRPRTDVEIEAFVVQMARDNSRWGYARIAGELLKLSIALDPTTVKHILERHGIPPAPLRGRSNWRTFLNHYKHQMLACDFLTVETLGLQTLYVLFFIELGSREVYFAGCTAHPHGTWISQQARQMLWVLQDSQRDAAPMRFLIHDRDSKFTGLFDDIFVSEGIDIVLTPYRAPQANAFAERWIRSLREECLDQILILGQRHLRSVIREYVAFYNQLRPHQGLDQQAPLSGEWHSGEGAVGRRDILGGIIHSYHREAA